MCHFFLVTHKISCSILFHSTWIVTETLENTMKLHIARYILILLILSIMVFLANLANSHFLDRTVFIFMSQEGNQEIAESSKKELVKNLKAVEAKPNILLLHKDIPTLGGWTILPTLNSLVKKFEKQADWFVFLDEAGRVETGSLTKVLEKYDPSDTIFLGKALRDREAVIIHNYNEDYEFKYPDFSAGFVFSSQLVVSLSRELNEKNFELIRKEILLFSIDAQYELSKVLKAFHVKKIKEDGNKEVLSSVVLNHEDSFCVKPSKGCATWKADLTCRSTQNEVITIAEQTLFAVKTCKKFHSERLPIIFQTWSKAALNIEYFSEYSEDKYGTKVLPGVTKNTETGHCMKTEAILKYFGDNAESKGWKWLVIADDDTIMGVQKLLEFLNCYNHKEPLVIGERYGFRVAEGKYGYDYVTGGGGMVFSHKMVRMMLKNDRASCQCPRPDQPDDMYFAGSCVAGLGLNIVHSDRFHQARPDDYSPDLLKDHDPISFHKFWNHDPIKVYEKFFKSSDTSLTAYKYKKLSNQEL